MQNLHELVIRAGEQITLMEILPIVVGFLLVSLIGLVGFFLRYLFMKSEAEQATMRAEINRTNLEIGGIKKDIEIAKRDIDNLGALIRELRK